MPLEQEIQHLCALADVYKRSATETLNIYNLLRASGLYNYCLVSYVMYYLCWDPENDILTIKGIISTICRFLTEIMLH